MKNIIIISIGVLVTVFLGLIIFAIMLMGDRFCDIQIQNQGTETLMVKTIRYTTANDSTSIEDSVILKPSDKLKIGKCINCSTLKDTDFEYDAILIFDRANTPKLLLRKNLAEFLSKFEKDGCGTYFINI